MYRVAYVIRTNRFREIGIGVNIENFIICIIFNWTRLEYWNWILRYENILWIHFYHTWNNSSSIVQLYSDASSSQTRISRKYSWFSFRAINLSDLVRGTTNYETPYISFDRRLSFFCQSSSLWEAVSRFKSEKSSWPVWHGGVRFAGKRANLNCDSGILPRRKAVTL